MQINFSASQITGIIDAPDGANVKIYSPVECVSLFTWIVEENSTFMFLILKLNIPLGTITYLFFYVDCRAFSKKEATKWFSIIIDSNRKLTCVIEIPGGNSNFKKYSYINLFLGIPVF